MTVRSTASSLLGAPRSCLRSAASSSAGSVQTGSAPEMNLRPWRAAWHCGHARRKALSRRSSARHLRGNEYNCRRMPYILSLDQGTTSSRAILFDQQGNSVAQAQHEFEQRFPNAGWVEHDPYDILTSQLNVAVEVLTRAGIRPRDVVALGITNQRETTIVWDRETGKPVYNAIVWQDRRTANFCDALKERGLEEKVRAKTGLPIDAYFSATKIRWILENVPGARERAAQGKL